MTFKRIVDVIEYLVLASAVVVVIALFTNDGSTPSSTASTGGAVSGEAVYAANCAGCHGGDGGGGVGPALAGGAVVEAFPDPADQIAVIADGRSGMPAFGGRLSPEEIEAVTDYTRDDL